jgi:hypothetical protein
VPFATERPQRSLVARSGSVLMCRGHGGRTWWAHARFRSINIGLTILRKKVEDLMNVKGIGEKSFLKLKPLITVSSAKAASAEQ